MGDYRERVKIVATAHKIPSTFHEVARSLRSHTDRTDVTTKLSWAMGRVLCENQIIEACTEHGTQGEYC